MLDVGTIKKIIDTAAQWGTQKLILSGNGEPTLHPDFADIVTYADQKKLKLELLTNGTFPLNLLPVMARIHTISVNLSAVHATSYNNTHHPKTSGLFNRVIKNLKILASLSKKYHRPSINIIFIVTQHSYPSIPGILALAKDFGIDSIIFKRFSPDTATQKLRLNAKGTKELNEIIAEQQTRTWPFTHNLENFKAPLEHHPEIQTIRCSSGLTELTIEADQRVGFCCCASSNFYIGSMKKNTLSNLWYNSKVKKYRRYALDGINLDKHPRCRECPPWRYNNMAQRINLKRS